MYTEVGAKAWLPSGGSVWKYEPEYAYASVRVDLESRENTKVIWKTAACAKFNR